MSPQCPEWVSLYYSSLCIPYLQITPPLSILSAYLIILFLFSIFEQRQTIHVPVKVPSTAAAASRRTTRRSKSPHRDRRRRRRTPPRSQKPTMYAAQIPPGVAPGQQFQISIHGKQYRVTCPANTYVGQTIHVPISR